MSQENVALVHQRIAAINEAYAQDDITPWREPTQLPDAVLSTPRRSTRTVPSLP
jgi:hypothetical protein